MIKQYVFVFNVPSFLLADLRYYENYNTLHNTQHYVDAYAPWRCLCANCNREHLRHRCGCALHTSGECKFADKQQQHRKYRYHFYYRYQRNGDGGNLYNIGTFWYRGSAPVFSFSPNTTINNNTPTATIDGYYSLWLEEMAVPLPTAG